jgi:hypothetical protein
MADPPLTNPHKIPLIKNGPIEAIVSEGRRAVVANLVADWTPQGLCQEAFEEALSETRYHWLREAIGATGVLRPAEEVYTGLKRREQIAAQREAYAELTAYFDSRMAESKNWIMDRAHTKLLDRAERIVIRVFRSRIEIVDLHSSKPLHRYADTTL